MLHICSIVISLICFICVTEFYRQNRPKTLILRAHQNVCMRAKSMNKGLWNYEKVNKYLLQNGASLHYGARVSPVSFLVTKIITCMVGLYLGCYINGFVGVVLMIVFFSLPNYLLEVMNKRDNETMLPELSLMFNVLSLQIKAGVYVTDALSECYGSIHGKRLRYALFELSGDIVMNADMDDALESFQGKFDNQYIDSLCIIILQAMESGQAVALFGDIAEQINEMELRMLHRRKLSLDRSITFYQLAIFTAVMIAALYACINTMFDAITLF